jgi:hypothetical protein
LTIVVSVVVGRVVVVVSVVSVAGVMSIPDVEKIVVTGADRLVIAEGAEFVTVTITVTGSSKTLAATPTKEETACAPGNTLTGSIPSAVASVTVGSVAAVAVAVSVADVVVVVGIPSSQSIMVVAAAAVAVSVADVVVGIPSSQSVIVRSVVTVVAAVSIADMVAVVSTPDIREVVVTVADRVVTAGVAESVPEVTVTVMVLSGTPVVTPTTDETGCTPEDVLAMSGALGFAVGVTVTEIVVLWSYWPLDVERIVVTGADRVVTARVAEPVSEITIALMVLSGILVATPTTDETDCTPKDVLGRSGAVVGFVAGVTVAEIAVLWSYWQPDVERMVVTGADRIVDTTEVAESVSKVTVAVMVLSGTLVVTSTTDETDCIPEVVLVGSGAVMGFVGFAEWAIVAGIAVLWSHWLLDVERAVFTGADRPVIARVAESVLEVAVAVVALSGTLVVTPTDETDCTPEDVLAGSEAMMGFAAGVLADIAVLWGYWPPLSQGGSEAG